MERGVLDVREVPTAGNVFQAAIQVPGPAMEWAFEFPCIPLRIGFTQLRAAMQARVVIGLHAAIGHACHENRVRAYVVCDVVASLRNMLFAADPLPNLRPKLVDLAAEEFR